MKRLPGTCLCSNVNLLAGYDKTGIKFVLFCFFVVGFFVCLFVFFFAVFVLVQSIFWFNDKTGIKMAAFPGQTADQVRIFGSSF